MLSQRLYAQMYTDCDNLNCEGGFFAHCGDNGGTISIGACPETDAPISKSAQQMPDTVGGDAVPLPSENTPDAPTRGGCNLSVEPRPPLQDALLVLLALGLASVKRPRKR